MKNVIKVDFQNGRIVMDREFAKNCANPNSAEYSQLQRVRQDYPNFTVSTRTCKSNPQKESYKGLTYEYMEHYILTHESKDTVLEVLDEYNELRLIAACHSCSHRYPVIKRWFLAKYPEIMQFGLLKVQQEDISKASMKVIGAGQELPPTGTEGQFPTAS